VNLDITPSISLPLPDGQ